MGRHSEFALSDSEHNALVEARRLAKQAGDHELRRRIRAVLLLGSEGRSREEVADICEAGLTTVYYWQRRYREHGIEGLHDRYKPRPCRLSTDQQNKIRATVEAGPEAAGFETGIWTAALVAKVVQSEFHITYTVSGATRLLRRLGFTVQVPQTQLARANPEQQQLWLEQTYPTITEAAQKEGGVIFFSGTNASSNRRAQRPGPGRGWVRAQS